MAFFIVAGEAHAVPGSVADATGGIPAMSIYCWLKRRLADIAFRSRRTFQAIHWARNAGVIGHDSVGRTFINAVSVV